MHSDFFNQQNKLQIEAKRFCRYESIRDAVYAYTDYSLVDHLRNAESELDELMDHWEQMEMAAEFLIAELCEWDLYELAHQVNLKKEQFSTELEKMAQSILDLRAKDK